MNVEKKRVIHREKVENLWKKWITCGEVGENPGFCVEKSEKQMESGKVHEKSGDFSIKWEKTRKIPGMLAFADSM